MDTHLGVHCGEYTRRHPTGGYTCKTVPLLYLLSIGPKTKINEMKKNTLESRGCWNYHPLIFRLEKRDGPCISTTCELYISSPVRSTVTESLSRVWLGYDESHPVTWGHATNFVLLSSRPAPRCTPSSQCGVAWRSGLGPPGSPGEAIRGSPSRLEEDSPAS